MAQGSLKQAKTGLPAPLLPYLKQGGNRQWPFRPRRGDAQHPPGSGAGPQPRSRSRRRAGRLWGERATQWLRPLYTPPWRGGCYPHLSRIFAQSAFRARDLFFREFFLFFHARALYRGPTIYWDKYHVQRDKWHVSGTNATCYPHWASVVCCPNLRNRRC